MAKENNPITKSSSGSPSTNQRDQQIYDAYTNYMKQNGISESDLPNDIWTQLYWRGKLKNSLSKYGLTQYIPSDGAFFTDVQRDYILGLDKWYGTQYWDQYISQAPAVFMHGASYEDDYNRDQATAQEMAEIASQKREETYNNELSNVSRQAAAGLNPDLTGIPDSAGKASENSEREITPTTYMAQKRQLLSEIPFKLFSSIASGAELFMGMKSRNIDNALKELKLNGGAGDFLVQLLAGTSPVFKKDSEGNDTSDLDIDSTTNVLLNAIRKIDFSDVHSPLLRKVLNRAKGLYGSSLDKDGSNVMTSAVANVLTRLNAGTAQNRYDIGNLLGDPKYSDDLGKMVERFTTHFNNYTQRLYDIEVKFNNSMQSMADDEALLKTEEVNELIKQGVPKEEAVARYTNARAQSEVDKYNKEMESMWNSLLQAVDGDKWYNVFAKLMIGILRSQLSTPFVGGLLGRMSNTQPNINITNQRNVQKSPTVADENFSNYWNSF